MRKIELVADGGHINYSRDMMKDYGKLLFNEKPRDGIKFCIEQGIISKNGHPKKIAKFLKNTSDGLSKFAIGQYLGSHHTDPEVVKAYVDAFGFSG